MNTIKIKHGSGDPSGKLQPYELGFRDDTGALYINKGTDTVQLTGLAATGLINDNNYLKIPTLSAATSGQAKVLVADNNNIIYSRTPAQLRSDIGAFASSGGTVSGATTFSKTVTISGLLTAKGAIVVDTDSYGNYDPNGVPGDSSKPAKGGVVGQLYFVVTG